MARALKSGLALVELFSEDILNLGIAVTMVYPRLRVLGASRQSEQLAATTYCQVGCTAVFIRHGQAYRFVGLAFKADTNDTRESPAIRIAKDLLEEGRSAIYDPVLLNRYRDLGVPPSDEEVSWQRSANPVELVGGLMLC